MIPELAAFIGLVPLLWLGGLHRGGQQRDAAYWWLAAAFGVSFLADTLARWINPDVVGNVYPVSQVALIGAVFLDRREAAILLGVLTLTAIAAVLWRGPTGADVLLYTVSHGAAAGIVYDRRGLGRLRTALLVYFGLGLVAWWMFALWPNWTAWGGYQITRALGIALFCWAALHHLPTLRLARAA